MQRIGTRYRIVGEAFGRGAGALVHRAFDDVRGEEVALKTLSMNSDAVENAEAIALFEREYYTLAQIRHPNIIRVHDYGIDDGTPYYTMELLDGRDVRELAPIEHTRASQLLREVASALALLHARRLVHRDLSSRNVRCTSDGHAKLIDFGTMVPMGLAEDAAGTPPFMPPESLRGEALDARADLFGLGALGYFMLLGRHAFPAQHLGDLREVWRSRPQAPHMIDPSIPRALGELVMSLLQMERTRRPANAAEVVSRLTTLAGLPREDHAALQSAHIAVPKLVGRERTLMGVRKRALRVVRGRGAALLVEGEPGLGRSRMLDACALEGQIVGALPLRAEAAHGRMADYALVRALLRELLQLAPEYTLEAARPHGAVLGHLSTDLHERLGRTPLVTFASRYEERPAMQRALRSFFVALSDRKPLFIAIDNVHRGDEPSVSVLALLARLVTEHRIVIAVSAPPQSGSDALPALELLRENCETIRLAPLRDVETRALVESMLGSVPGVAELAQQLHRMSDGNPGMCLTLVQHLMARGVLRHGDDGWVIPERIEEDDLPRTVADACRMQLGALSPDALALAQALALSEGQVGLQDYLALLDHGEPQRLHAALHELLQRDILIGSGRSYGFRHVGISSAVRESLSTEQRRMQELRLALLLRARAAHPVVTAHHMLRADQPESAAACLLEYVQAIEEAPFFLEPTALPYVESTFEGVLAFHRSRESSPDDVILLELGLVGLSMFIDPVLAARYAPSIERTLRTATGLDLWEQSDASLDARSRITWCIGEALKIWERAPEATRGFHPLRALHVLGRYVLYSLAPTTTMLDAEGIERLRKLIEPFVPIAPVLEIIHDVARASHDICLALDARAAAGFTRILERVAEPDGAGLPVFVRTHFRLATLYALCLSRAFTTDPRIEGWIAELDADPLQQANAWRMRRHTHLMRGDVTQAQRCGDRLEALMLENSGVRTLDGGTAYADLRMAVLSTDLGELKRAVANIAQLAKRYPRYVPLEACALGVYELATGDTDAGRRSLERGLADMRPDTHVAWGTAIDDYLWLRYELDGAELVAPLVEQALARAHAADLDLRKTSCLSALLALCEAELGERARSIERARATLDACHAYGLAPLQMGNVYLRCARVGVISKQHALFEEGARNYALLCKQSGLPGLLARYDALATLAHGSDARAGATLDGLVAESTQKLGGRRLRSELRKQLAIATDPRERVARTLRWLVQRVRAGDGHLYTVSRDTPHCIVSANGVAPSAATDTLVRARLIAAQSDTEAITERQPKDRRSTPPRVQPCVLVIEQRVQGSPHVTAVIVLEQKGEEQLSVPFELVRAVEVELDPKDLRAFGHDDVPSARGA